MASPMELLTLNSSLLPPANEVWGKVIFLHQFVILFTGEACVVAWGGGVCGCLGGHVGLLWGACMVAPRGGMCNVAQGEHAWLLQGGACMVAPGGHAWLLPGGHVWFYSGGMCGFIWGVCMFYSGGMHGFIGGHAWFYLGGACMVFSVFSDTMRYGQ